MSFINIVFDTLLTLIFVVSTISFVVLIGKVIGSVFKPQDSPAVIALLQLQLEKEKKKQQKKQMQEKSKQERKGTQDQSTEEFNKFKGFLGKLENEQIKTAIVNELIHQQQIQKEENFVLHVQQANAIIQENQNREAKEKQDKLLREQKKKEKEEKEFHERVQRSNKLAQEQRVKEEEDNNQRLSKEACERKELQKIRDAEFRAANERIRVADETERLRQEQIAENELQTRAQQEREEAEQREREQANIREFVNILLHEREQNNV